MDRVEAWEASRLQSRRNRFRRDEVRRRCCYLRRESQIGASGRRGMEQAAAGTGVGGALQALQSRLSLNGNDSKSFLAWGRLLACAVGQAYSTVCEQSWKDRWSGDDEVLEDLLISSLCRIRDTTKQTEFGLTDLGSSHCTRSGPEPQDCDHGDPRPPKHWRSTVA